MLLARRIEYGSMRTITSNCTPNTLNKFQGVFNSFVINVRITEIDFSSLQTLIISDLNHNFNKSQVETFGTGTIFAKTVDIFSLVGSDAHISILFLVFSLNTLLETLPKMF